MLKPILNGVAWGLAAAVLTSLVSVWHRSAVRLGPITGFPLGLTLALIAVVALALAARAASGWAGLAGVAAGVFIAAQAVALRGPGGDILIQGDAIGFIWMAGAPVATLTAAFAPRAWLRGRQPTAAATPSAASAASAPPRPRR